MYLNMDAYPELYEQNTLCRVLTSPLLFASPVPVFVPGVDAATEAGAGAGLGPGAVGAGAGAAVLVGGAFISLKVAS